jgi:hypothetical protein
MTKSCEERKKRRKKEWKKQDRANILSAYNFFPIESSPACPN